MEAAAYLLEYNPVPSFAPVMKNINPPICIAGMHRSGTSMVARLLQACGLFLGPEKELEGDSNNGEQHWENVKVVALNDEILNRLGGSWHHPPEFRAGWERTVEITPLIPSAKKLIKRLGVRQPWGWKDPRNSLTLPFWRQLIPDLRVVICVRNPLEVAHSLRVRGDLVAIPLFELWQSYYRELLLAIPRSRRVVTHYDSYFQDPVVELQRVASVIGMQVPTGTVTRVCGYVSTELRHHRVETGESAASLPSDVLTCYLDLCREAGQSNATTANLTR